MEAVQSECYLPNAIDSFIKSGDLVCVTIETQSQWLGITYPEDKALVKKALAKITQTSPYFEDWDPLVSDASFAAGASVALIENSMTLSPLRILIGDSWLM